MVKVKTATGREYESDYYSHIETPPRLYLRIFTPLEDAASVFKQPAETIALTIGQDYVTEFTRLVAVVPEPDGAVKVILARE